MTGWHLHLSGRDDLRAALVDGGIGGRLVTLTDPLVHGRLPPGPLPDYVAGRAEALARGRGEDHHDAIYDRLVADYLQLDRIDGPVRALFWGEAGLADQLLLLRVLERLGSKAIDRLWIVQGPASPGLATLAPPMLVALAAGARPATPTMVAIARTAWAALVNDSADRLARLVHAGTDDWPALGPALLRRLRDLPWRESGLSQTERLILVAMLGGAGTTGGILAAVAAAEPAPFLTGPTIRPVLARLVVNGLVGRRNDRFGLTDLGRRVLSGSARCCTPAARWLWDEAAGTPTPVDQPAVDQPAAHQPAARIPATQAGATPP